MNSKLAFAQPIARENLLRLEALLAQTSRAPSEYSIPNLYLYRARHDYALVDGDVPFVTGRTYDNESHAMPLARLDDDIAARWLRLVDCIYPLGESEATQLAHGGRFRIDYRESDTDYLYDGARLATLKGAKVKRVQAARFAKQEPTLSPFDPDDAYRVLQGWLEDSGRGPDHADAHECAEAIACREELGLEGVLVRLGKKPVSFLLAGRPRGEERVLHFAKGRKQQLGVYPWMFAQFAAMTESRLLNFEQDLGNPGLAQSKRALGPIGRVRKYRLRNVT